MASWSRFLRWMAIVVPVTLSAQEAVHVRDAWTSISVDSATAYFVDLSDTLTLAGIVALDSTHSPFLPTHAQNNFGYLAHPLWLRIIVHNDQHRGQTMFVTIRYATIGSVSFFERTALGDVREFHSGLFLRHAEQPVRSQFHVFPCSCPPQSQSTVYLRIVSPYGIYFPIVLQSPEAFVALSEERSLFIGFFIGALGALVLYNAFLYFSTRDQSYVLYCLYAAAFGLYYAASERVLTHLVLDEPLLTMYGIPAGASGVFFFGSLFAINFLQLRKNSGIVFWWMCGLGAFAAIFGGVALLHPDWTSKFLSIISPTYAFSTVTVGIIVWRRGNPVAKFYVLATALFTIAIVVRISRIVALSAANTVTEYGVPFGILLEMTVLAFALGFRINLLKAEKDREQQALRSKLASDLHDDVSATLSSISFFTEAVERTTGVRRKQYLARIGESARDAKETISDIIWSVDPQHDNLPQLLNRCERYAADLFESTGIVYGVEREDDAELAVSPEFRQHFWLMFKEIVTNIARHARASQATVTLRVRERRLHLIVTDNGKGFGTTSDSFGNGIRNVKRRAGALHGTATLTSAKGGGTTWTIDVPL